MREIERCHVGEQITRTCLRRFSRCGPALIHLIEPHVRSPGAELLDAMLCPLFLPSLADLLNQIPFPRRLYMARLPRPCSPRLPLFSTRRGATAWAGPAARGSRSRAAVVRHREGVCKIYGGQGPAWWPWRGRRHGGLIWAGRALPLGRTQPRSRIYVHDV